MKELKQLIYEINGQKYLLIEALVTEAHKVKFEAKLKKHNCIFQGIRELKQGGLLTNGYAIINILVPFDNIIDFNNE